MPPPTTPPHTSQGLPAPPRGSHSVLQHCHACGTYSLHTMLSLAISCYRGKPLQVVHACKLVRPLSTALPLAPIHPLLPLTHSLKLLLLPGLQSNTQSSHGSLPAQALSPSPCPSPTEQTSRPNSSHATSTIKLLNTYYCYRNLAHSMIRAKHLQYR